MTGSKKIKDIRIYQVNAFIGGHCRGNPAGVCLLPEARDDGFYRRVAIRMGLPETAFVVRDGGVFSLRWFTRGGSEVDLCGHATLATAFILSERGYVRPGDTLRFQTRGGTLTAGREGGSVTLGFPLDEVVGISGNEPDFKTMMGFRPVYTGRTRFDYLLVADSQKTVKGLAPDIEELKKIQTRGVIVTARSDGPGYDFVSRFFAPAVGIDEDPVTGSAHCALGPYWRGILKKNVLTGYQASREGGIVKVTVLKDGVVLSGRAREVPVSVDIKQAILSY